MPTSDDAGPASTFSTEEREAIADQPTVFFEQPAADLDPGEAELDRDEEIGDVGGALERPSADDPLIVEEAFAEPPPPEAEVAEPPHEAEPEPPAEPDSGDEQGTSEEDVLEETPEFLRDNPDDDELWFEQGEPKDFDF